MCGHTHIPRSIFKKIHRGGTREEDVVGKATSQNEWSRSKGQQAESVTWESSRKETRGLIFEKT